MPSNPAKIVLTAASSTAGTSFWVPDMNQNPPISIGFYGLSTGTTTYGIEHSGDYTGSSTFLSSNATWYLVSSTTLVTSASYYTFTTPTSIFRITSTGATASVPATVTIIQGG